MAQTGSEDTTKESATRAARLLAFSRGRRRGDLWSFVNIVADAVVVAFAAVVILVMLASLGFCMNVDGGAARIQKVVSHIERGIKLFLGSDEHV